MKNFSYRNGVYSCDGLELPAMADALGTPAYIYSQAAIEENCRAFVAAFSTYPTTICFAVKALSNLSILRCIFAQGLGADLVSRGELERALLAGVNARRCVLSGVGKQEDEIARAMACGVMSINVESPWELDLISTVAQKTGHKAQVSIRINPNIDAKTNEKIATGLYTSKFGVPEGDLGAILEKVEKDPNVELIGLACHIGSQITDLRPIQQAAERMAEVAKAWRARGLKLRLLDMGGGLGIAYHQETPPALADYGRCLITAVKETGLHLLIEPGRSLVGNTGIILTRVLGVKETPQRSFVIVDAAMNDLMRPTLYNSYHEILPVQAVSRAASDAKKAVVDFVGPICETGDYLGKSRHLPIPERGDLFAVRGCGAYAASMASRYNSRPMAPEVLVQDGGYRVVRPRESLESLWTSELALMVTGDQGQ